MEDHRLRWKGNYQAGERQLGEFFTLQSSHQSFCIMFTKELSCFKQGAELADFEIPYSPTVLGSYVSVFLWSYHLQHWEKK